MQQKQNIPASSSSLNLGDIYHVLFRHKWKILAIWTLGLAVGAALLLKGPGGYKSKAGLFIRYVVENRSLRALAGESDIRPSDTGGQGIINAEVQILESFDLALEVADAIGPENVLEKAGARLDRIAAAAVIHSGVTVEAANKSTVIQISFTHHNRNLVQPILSQYINSYRAKHKEIHQSAGAQYEFLTQQTDQLRTQLAETEQELRKIKVQAGVGSLDTAKQSYLERITQLQASIGEAEAELAEQRAIVGTNPVRTETTTTVATNTPVRPIPADTIAEYRRITGLLQNLERREQELLVQFTPENLQVKELQAQIRTHQKHRELLETEYPQLTGIAITVTDTSGGRQPGSAQAQSPQERIRALEARLGALNRQLADIKSQVATLENLEGNITDLQRRKELQEQNYRLFSANLEKARIDETLGAGRISNISLVQSPTPPERDFKKLLTVIAGVVFGSLAGGLALAFILELYLDRSFKRPSELEAKLGLPLFISIPRASLNGKQVTDSKKSRLLSWNSGSTDSAPGSSLESPAPNGLAPLKPSRQLQLFFESLRDRLIMFFELKKMTHNPKLVAVTSCGQGVGVTTVASGLAASLSETGEGNVLLVDMNLQGGEAHYFHKGKLACDLDEALEQGGKRNEAMLQDNLYLATETTSNENLPRILHKRFSQLMPKLRASDYDYIIFDMPPVSQISPTLKLTRFMDMVLMVVESEKSDRDTVKRATALLSETQPNVGLVFNKNQTYVPRRLQHEL